MERLWAPWRMAYINGGLEKVECFLCAAASHPSDDEANLVIWRGEKVFCIMNRFPYNNGHLMVAPSRHTADLETLSAAESAELFRLVQKSLAVLRRALKPHGFNVGANLGRVAGAGVAGHAHVHIVPRWLGDVNYMPLLSETKVISEHLAETYDRLRRGFPRSGTCTTKTRRGHQVRNPNSE